MYRNLIAKFMKGSPGFLLLVLGLPLALFRNKGTPDVSWPSLTSMWSMQPVPVRDAIWLWSFGKSYPNLGAGSTG